MPKEGRVTVAFFLPSLEPGGTERNVVNLVNNIDRRKYLISLVLGNIKGDFVKQIGKDIPITNLDAAGSIGLFFGLIRYFKKQKPDIFISAFPRINIICTVARMFAKAETKIVITEHSVFSLLPVIAKTSLRRLFARFFMPTLCKLIYPKADAIICVSSGIAEDLSKIFYYQNGMKVIYNPVIDDKVYTLAEESVDHPWFLDIKIPIIVAAGRLVACKDYPTLFNAFGEIIKKQPAHLVVLGAGSEKQTLMDLAKKLGISEQVAFLGFQENPYKYMKRASVFVLSSLQEGFGNAIIEAMACGAPVISTDCPTGPREIISNRKNGILVAMQDYKALAKAVMEVLDDLSLRQQLSREGKKRARDFLITNSVEKYEKVFDELTGNENYD